MITVDSIDGLRVVHVAEFQDGTTAWVIDQEAKFVLELHSGATADGLSIVEPIAGSPIAGYPDARWVRLNSSSDF